jgi:hypothetical protein
MGIHHATAAPGTDSGDGKISHNAWDEDHYPPHKYDATTAPGVGDDSNDGYAVGSIWVDVTGDAAYICVDASVGAAVWNPFEATGGAGPLMAIDDVALHADGDEFDDDTLAAWTSVGVTATAVTTEVYDNTCLDLAFSDHNKYIWKTITVSDNIEISLTIHGFDRSDNHCQTATGEAMGVFFSNDAGTGICCFPYYDNGIYLWGLSSYGLGSSPVVVTSPWCLTLASVRTANATFVIKLKKVGSTITGSWSDDGGATWKTNTSTDSTSLTRMGIIAAYDNSVPSPVLRVGRFNVTEL